MVAGSAVLKGLSAVQEGTVSGLKKAGDKVQESLGDGTIGEIASWPLKAGAEVLQKAPYALPATGMRLNKSFKDIVKS
jgi:hypothetical protein